MHDNDNENWSTSDAEGKCGGKKGRCKVVIVHNVHYTKTDNYTVRCVCVCVFEVATMRSVDNLQAKCMSFWFSFCFIKVAGKI